MKKTAGMMGGRKEVNLTYPILICSEALSQLEVTRDPAMSHEETAPAMLGTKCMAAAVLAATPTRSKSRNCFPIRRGFVLRTGTVPPFPDAPRRWSSV